LRRSNNQLEASMLFQPHLRPTADQEYLKQILIRSYSSQYSVFLILKMRTKKTAGWQRVGVSVAGTGQLSNRFLAEFVTFGSLPG
jgi:hypothetical protein